MAFAMMVTLDDVQAARKRIFDQIYLSPCARSETLSRLSGSQAFLKLENLQMTGAYKERGALNKLLTMPPADRAKGLTFVHPFDDPAVIAGQGTVALELLEQVPDLEGVLVPIGGGGIVSGMAAALKAAAPKVRVIGVETEVLPCMLASIEEGHLVTVEPATTIADGIAVKRAGELTFQHVQKLVDEIVTVSEEE